MVITVIIMILVMIIIIIIMILYCCYYYYHHFYHHMIIIMIILVLSQSITLCFLIYVFLMYLLLISLVSLNRRRSSMDGNNDRRFLRNTNGDLCCLQCRACSVLRVSTVLVVRVQGVFHLRLCCY